MVPVLEVIVAIAYLAIGYGGIANAVANMDFNGIFESVKGAIIFLVAATAIITGLCFLPAFKSKANLRIAIWNIIWMIFTVSSM